MNTKSVLLETIIVGFLCLLVFLLFISLQLTVEELNKVIVVLSSISGGASALLVIIAFMFSFIFGSLSYRIGADISRLYQKINGSQEPQLFIDKPINERILQDYYSKWTVKSFYRSIMLLVPFILVQSLMLDYKLSSGEYFFTIILIGSLIEIVVVIAFITQRIDFLEWHKKLKELLIK